MSEIMAEVDVPLSEQLQFLNLFIKADFAR
jgi:hypothetical protein